MTEEQKPLEPSIAAELRYLRERVKLLEAVVENFPGGLLLFDRNLRLAFCNNTQRQLLEYPAWFFGSNPPTITEIFWFNATRGEYGEGDPQEFVERRMSLVAKREEHVFERRRPNGTLLEVRGKPLEGGGFVTTYLDITEQRKGQEALRFLAHHDILTNLSNRFSAFEAFKNRLDKMKDGSTLAIIFLDLDGFKPVNDRFGHAVGDEVLKNVSLRMSHTVRENDHVSRFGGDEFLVLMNIGSGHSEAEILASRLQQRLSEPFSVGDHEVSISASIGIAVWPDDGSSIDELVTIADQRMYAAKKKRTEHKLNIVVSNSRH